VRRIFITSPFNSKQRLYATGDSVKWLPGGGLAFLNRADEQVNVCGLNVRYEAPISEPEKTIALIWQDVLKRERVGRNDNFFNLGGHSFLAIRMLAALKESGFEAPLKRFFQSPVLSDLAQMSTDNRWQR